MAYAPNSIHGRVSPSGRLSLPAHFRKAVGLEDGGDVIVELHGHEIRINTVEEIVARAQALTRHLLENRPAASLDAFLAERHRQAERE